MQVKKTKENQYLGFKIFFLEKRRIERAKATIATRDVERKLQIIKINRLNLIALGDKYFLSDS